MFNHALGLNKFHTLSPDIDDRLLNRWGSWSLVSEGDVVKKRSSLFELKTSRGIVTRVPHDQNVLIFHNYDNKKNLIEYVPPSEIKPGRIGGRKGINSWNSYIGLPKLGDYQEAQIINVMDYLPKDQFFLTNDNHIAKVKVHKHGRTIVWDDLPTSIVLNEDFAFALGLYVAEGSVSQKTNNPDLLDGTVTYTLSGARADLTSAIQETFGDTFGFEMSIRDRIADRSSVDVVKNSLPVAYLMSALCGKGFLNKRVPPPIWLSPRNVRWAFIDGVLSGDGSNPTNIKNPSGLRDLSMCTFDGMYGVRQLLTDFGIYGHVSFRDRKQPHHFDSYGLGVHLTKKYSYSFETESYIWRPVASIEPLDVKVDRFALIRDGENDSGYVNNMIVQDVE